MHIFHGVVYSFAKTGAGNVNIECQVISKIIILFIFFLCCEMNLFCSGCFSEISMKAILTLLICHFTYRYIYVPMGGSQSSLPGMIFSTALTFAFVSYWHGGQSYLWYWGALNCFGVIVENGIKRILSVSLIRDLIVSWISLQFVFLFPSFTLI